MAGKIARKVICDWLERAKRSGLIAENGLNMGLMKEPSDLHIASSLQERAGDNLVLLKTDAGRILGVFGANRGQFRGTAHREDSVSVWFCPLDHFNADALRKFLPFTGPSTLSDRDATVGLGDRLGIASPGHLRLVMRESLDGEIAPVLAQQSVRELTLTARNYGEVLDAATWAVFQEGYRRPWGADGDHLKSKVWVKRALREGYTMITADVSEYIRGELASKRESEILSLYRHLDSRRREQWERRYLSMALAVDTGEAISFSREELARIALIYGEAVDHARRLYSVGENMGSNFDFELSIDETETPTLPQAHIFMAREMAERGVVLSSLAPRFEGEFQKGIDYLGDVERFEESFRIHAAIARHFGYRLSIHSGSDKFSVFPAIGKHTRGRFHVKTAGTNWLQALLVVSRQEPHFFRYLYRMALEAFPRAKRYYHITPDVRKLPDPSSLEDGELPTLLENPDARQILHVTYGELLRNPQLKRSIFRLLEKHIEEYWHSLEEHIGRHLELLGLGVS